MSFHQYEKISESTRMWDMVSRRAEFKMAKGPAGGPSKGKKAALSLDNPMAWVVTEKVHGANFLFIVSQGEDGTVVVKSGKRTGLLEDEDEFFKGYKKVVEQYTPASREAFQWIQRTIPHDPPLRSIYIYGELFGGAYPHPSVPVDPDVCLVQSGIYYSPTLQFCAFDVMTETRDGTKAYLDYGIAVKMFQECRFFFAEPLFVGSFEEASNYQVGFESTIPKRLGLPALPSPNIAEGVVAKRIKPLWVPTSKGDMVRATLKIKAEGFREEQALPDMIKDKGWGGDKGAGKGKKSSGKPVDPIEALAIKLAGLVNPNRLASVVSKVGRGKGKDRAHRDRVHKMFIQDVLEALHDAGDEYGPMLDRLDKPNKDILMTQLDRLTSALLDDRL
eukprot:TRINITY_DN12356_c0_g1_i3.p1 TRINITY_DN12356_c0_g1~~TRINITY_DN12356_c0_g1_i3.p1  ORF type:complete len:389 (-),score=81.15 TRINITY_DN12356_c0_g1_i3:9-1175(-)